MMINESFALGDDILCEGDPCGRLVAVAVKPTSARLVHLVVDPGGNEAPRLIPAAHAHPAEGGIAIGFTREQYDNAETAVVFHPEVVDAGSALDEERRWRRHDEVSSWPVFGLGSAALNPSIGAPAPAPAPEPHGWFEDRIPADEARISEATGLHAADGGIGRVAGVVVAAEDKRVTHFLVEEGHLWGHKRVAVPMGVVRKFDAEEVEVRLSKRQVKDLPSENDR